MTETRQVKSVFPVHQQWLAWLGLYVLAILLAHQVINAAYGFDLLLVNGGILLAALLVLSPDAKAQRSLLLILVLAVDWCSNIWLDAVPVWEAMWISLSLVMQAWLGEFLIRRYAPAARIPDTQGGVIGFSLFGVLIPAVLSALVPVIYSLATAGFSASGEMMAHWLWWFLRRFSSLVLITPLLVLMMRDWRERRMQVGLRMPALNREFVFMLIAGCVLAFILFRMQNPAGRALATYSYLLIPMMVLTAVRLPLTNSLFIMLSVSLVSLWADSLTAGGAGASQRSMMAMSVFLIINCSIVWLLGVLIHERRQAFVHAQKMREMYEMQSHVIQTLVKGNLAPVKLFEQICQIIIDQSEFRQACVTIVDGNEGNPGVDGQGELKTVCLKQGSSAVINDLNIDHRCELVRQVMGKRHAVFFEHCNQCPEFIDCPLKPVTHGSMAAFPVFKKDKMSVLAVLSVFSHRPGAFDPEMLRLFNEMTGDVGFALEVLESRQRLALTNEVFEHSHESIIIADASGTILNVNPAFTRITGYTRDEVIGQNPRILQSGKQDRAFYEKLWGSLVNEGCWAGEFWNKRKNGELYPQRGTITAVYAADGSIEHLISVMEDVSERVNAEEELRQMANYDVLTGLPNRILLQDRFNVAIAAVHREQKPWSLLFIDLDDFKHVNDALGHQYGDELLQQVGRRLVSHMRETDTLSRFGGDEFIVLMQGNEKDAALLAERLIGEIRRPYILHDQSVHIGSSVGIATVPGDGESLDQLISAADAAMYQAKARGRGQFAFYAPEMQIKAQGRITLKTELEKAIARDELCLFYQPKIRLGADNNAVVFGFEALVRWNHPDKGLITPVEFIPAAEDSGQIADIDRWVMQRAIVQIATWQQQQYRPMPVAINVSATLFSRSDFTTDLARMLSQAEVPAHLLELEITEYVATLDMQYTLKTLNALKQMGVGLSIDDFGTGYSSLAYLRDFPIDTVKIDMDFVKQVHNNTKNQGIVRAIIALANTLSIDTIAEGVQCQEELTFLQMNGCRQYQGYFFSKPRACGEIEHQFLQTDDLGGIKMAD